MNDKIAKSENHLRKFLDREIISRHLGAGYNLIMNVGGSNTLNLINGADSFTANSISFKTDTQFNLGSVTKPFTAALVHKLGEDFGVQINDCVKKFIPEFAFDDVTLLHLMTHTTGFSGFVQIPGAPATLPFGKSDAHEYLQAIYSIRTRDFPLNSQCQYFSPGYAILMDVIERVTKVSIESYACTSLFVPLEMRDTSYEVRKADPCRCPVPTSFFTDGSENRDMKWIDCPAIGEGGMVSTGEDLMKFGRMLLNHGVSNGRNVFSEKSIDRMMQEATLGRFFHTGTFFYRGIGESHPTLFSDRYSERALAHAGFCGTLLWIEPALDMTAAILTNSIRVGEEWYSGPNNLMWKISDLLLISV